MGWDSFELHSMVCHHDRIKVSTDDGIPKCIFCDYCEHVFWDEKTKTGNMTADDILEILRRGYQ
jgi:hypothetical protein